jgi:hypothetical protein
MNAVLQRRPTRLEQFEALRKELAGFPEVSDDNRLFQDLFSRTQYLLEMQDLELAKFFRVSRPTIGRWAAGHSAPHPVMRQVIIRQLGELVTDRYRFLERNEESRFASA